MACRPCQAALAKNRLRIAALRATFLRATAWNVGWYSPAMRTHLAFATVLPLLAACPASDDDGGNDDSNGTGAEADSVTLATINVGLAFGYVAEAPARVEPVINALAGLEADVVCVQELWVSQNDAGVWNSDVVEQVLAGTAENYPHQYWSRTVVPDDVVATGCTVEEAEPLEACAQQFCGDVEPDNLADCILADCGAEFTGTSAECQNCMVANLGQPLEDIVAACKGASTSGIVYDGHNGLAILSKLPLSGSAIVELDYAVTSRAVLTATVETAGGNPVEVMCTHIAADLSSSLEYPSGGTYAGFAEENAGQMAAILELASAASPDASLALLGDFNHGPATSEGGPELPEVYQTVLDAGYVDPIAETDVTCTFCDENTLNVGDGRGGVIIDHVYLKTEGTVVDTARILDQTVPVVAADGTEQTLHLSDHFGVQTTIEFAAAP